MPDSNPILAPDTSTQEPAYLLESAVELVRGELDQVNQVIQHRLESDITLINTLAAYIINSGGKRLRPLILLLSARCYGYRGRDHVLLAAVIEFIHTATLLHDDVVDASATRRGKSTANEVWGNEASVLVGDFLYSRSFEMMVDTGSMEVMRIMAGTTNAIAEGEVLQLLNTHTPETTEQQYMETIRRKTAKLFESAAWLGGVVAGQEDHICKALAKYGLHLGTAFQLVDDILDYSAPSSEEIGKDVGDDLAEGKPTLPLIYALQHGNEKQKSIVSRAIENGDRERIQEILEIVRSTGALDYSQERARDHARLAMEALAPVPENPFRQALADLAEFSVIRGY